MAPSLPADLAGRLIHLGETGSTNADAMRLAAAGETGPLWIVADRQTAGRGRQGRAWSTDPANLSASFLVTADAEPPQAAQVSLLAGVALAEAIQALAGDVDVPGMILKWPNDLMIGGAKAAGILVETTVVASRLVIVIGFGVNVTRAPVVEGRATQSLDPVLARPVTKWDLLAALDASLGRWLADWDGGRGFAKVRDAWARHAPAAGSPVTIETGAGRTEGRFAGLDADGALLVEDRHGHVTRHTFGDVTLASRPETS